MAGTSYSSEENEREQARREEIDRVEAGAPSIEQMRAAAAEKIAAPAPSGFTPCQARLREADTTIAICNLPVGHEGRHIDSIRDEAWERGKVERMPAGAGEKSRDAKLCGARRGTTDSVCRKITQHQGRHEDSRTGEWWEDVAPEDFGKLGEATTRLCGAVRGVPEQGGDVCTRPKGHPGNHIDDHHRTQWAPAENIPPIPRSLPREKAEAAAALEFRHRVRILLSDPAGAVARLEHGDADAYYGRRLVEMLRGLDRACSPENSEQPSEGKVEACRAQQPVDVARGRPGFLCSEKAGHEGDHIARGSDKRELARWPRGEPTDPLKAMVAAVSLPLYRERLEKLRRELVGTPDAHPNRHDIEDEIIRVERLAFEAERVVGVRA